MWREQTLATVRRPDCRQGEGMHGPPMRMPPARHLRRTGGRAGGLAGWLAGRQAGRYTNIQTYSHSDTQAQRHTGTEAYKHRGHVHRSRGAHAHEHLQRTWTGTGYSFAKVTDLLSASGLRQH